MLKPKGLSLALSLTLAGCVAERSDPAASLNHPANPHAVEAPAFRPSHTLSISYSTASAPAEPAPSTTESMPTTHPSADQMQHMHHDAPSTKTKNHGAMNMDRDMDGMKNMGGMDGMEMDQSMPGMDHSRNPSSQPAGHRRHE